MMMSRLGGRGMGVTGADLRRFLHDHAFGAGSLQEAGSRAHKSDATEEHAVRIRSLPKDYRTATRPAAPPNRLSAARLVVLTSSLLAWLGAFAADAQSDAIGGEAEFIEFLEYLGSWEGAEEDWVQFLRAPDQTSVIEAADGEAKHAPESASL